MTRTLIPRAGCCSAKVVASRDFEKFWSCDILNDYVKCGFAISAQCPNILAVDVASGIGRVKGLYVENTTCCSVTSLTASMCNFIYVRVDRMCCNPTGWTFTFNTTGVTPTDSMLISVATTNGTTVTAVCNSPIGKETSSLLISTVYGGGTCSCTNPANTTIPLKEYNNLTFTTNTTCSNPW